MLIRLNLCKCASPIQSSLNPNRPSSMPSKALPSQVRRSSRIRSAITKFSGSGNRAHVNNWQRVRQRRKSGLLSLNDDCLSKILSQLELDDLFAVKDSCPELSRLTYLAAANIFRENEYVSLRINKDADAVKMLKTFGEFITDLCIDGDNSFSELRVPYNGDWAQYKDSPDFGAMLAHCTSLKHVKFRSVSVGSISVRQMRLPLRNVETLVFEHCNGILQKIQPLLGVCKMLKHLVVGPSSRSREPLDLFSSSIVFGTSMETIRMKIDSTYDASQFITYLKQLAELNNLKTLELGLMWEYPMTARMVQTLASMESLQELHLRRFIPSANFFKILPRFSNLRVCKLETNETITEKWTTLAVDFVAVKEENEKWLKNIHCATLYSLSLIRIK